MNRNSGYSARALQPWDEAEARMLAWGGFSTKNLAARYGVSQRCIQRALKRSGDIRRVSVGGWHADFEMSDEGPVRLTPWFPD